MEARRAISSIFLRRSVLFYTIVFFTLFTSIGEVISQFSFCTHSSTCDFSPLQQTSYGPAISQFQHIRDYVSRYGPPDCIFVGHSLVQTGINPQIFAAAFQSETGQTIRCYNAGMDGSSMSSTVPMALILSKLYNPTYLIVGLQANSFFLISDEVPAHIAENHFQENGWIQHELGQFNLEGWLTDNSVLYNALERYIPPMFPSQHTAPITDPTTAPVQTPLRRPDLHRTVDITGYGPLIVYRDSSPLFQSFNNFYDTETLDPQDFAAYEQIITHAQKGEFRLVFVEMPINLPSTLVKNTVSKARNYSREQGIPFLSTDGLVPLPPTAYSDQAHMQITGSIQFSGWLGAQIGEAVSSGALSNVNAPVWSPSLEQWPEPNYLSTLGLTDNSYAEYLKYSDSFDLLPRDATIFNPGDAEIERTLSQSLLGFVVDWDNGITQEEREKAFQLMSVLGKMRYQNELHLSPAEAQRLDQWHTSPNVSILNDLGIHYILCREERFSPNRNFCPPGIISNPNYLPIGTWNFEPVYELYRLYQVVKSNPDGRP